MTDTNQTDQVDQPEQPSVSIGDIMVLKQVVEVASARGALRANELSQVGEVYDRVSKWLDTVLPPEEVNEQADQGDVDA